MQTIRILLIEDDEDDYVITRNILKEVRNADFSLDWEPDAEAAAQRIGRQEHDAYLIDYRLGAVTGLELLAKAREMGVDRPFILLTGVGEDSLDRRAIELGASDFLVKGQFDATLLSRCLRYAIDRHQSQRQLMDSEARYKLLYQSNPEAIWVFSRKTFRLLTANPSASRFLGYSEAELLNLTTYDIRDPAEHQRYVDHHRNRQEKGIKMVNAGVWRYRHKDGHPVYGEVMVHDIDYVGEPACLVVVVDVTEKMAIQKALERQAELFRHVLDDARDAIVVLAGGAQVCYANAAAERLFEQSLAQLQETPPGFPETAEREFEYSVRQPSGQVLDLEVHQSETEWSGQAARLLSIRNVSGQRNSRRQLRLLKRSLDCSFNGVIITDAHDPELPIIYVNPAFERITGYSEREVLGRSCRFLQGAHRDPMAVEEIRHGIREHRAVNVVLRNFRKDGSEFWNDLHIAPVFDERGGVTHFVGIQNDVSERKRFEEELRFNASHDLLTGLPNRALFEDRLRQSSQVTARHHRRLAVVFIDLDRFKPINDSYGHAVGDQLLKEVARRIQEAVRPGDTITRLGGDEFIVLLADLARDEDVIPVVERLMAALARPYQIGDVQAHITSSIGIALGDGQSDDPVQLIQQADLAMYRAKEEGRNNYQWYTSDLNQQLVERLTLRNELQDALAQGQFELHYQPQIEGRSGRVVGLEALVRWRHPVKGMIPPAQFISIADDSGLMIPLGDWILETACRHISELARRGMRGLTMAVNISPRQFHRSNFVQSLYAMVDRYGLEPGMLEIELTESVLIDNIEQAIATLQEVKGIGVNISLDDFGTGYSSLSYLRRLPVDKVKIDRSFVIDIISNHHDAAITQAIIAMAHHLNHRVIAEGVETESQVAFLLKNQCDELQGFYFAKPMPFEATQTFLRDRFAMGLPVPSVNEDAKRTLLLLDDEENILRALSRVLRRDGYKVLMATRPQDAFELLARHDVQVIISDQRMPEMSGTEFLSRVKDLYPQTVRIVLSGYTDLKSVTEAVNQGAIYKFLSKPWEDEALRKEIAQVFVHAQSLRARGPEA